MGKYYVEVPVVMKLMVEVKAESKEEALEKVFDGDISIDVNDNADAFEWVEYEWEVHEHIVQGNVYYGGINEPYVEQVEEDED